MNENLGDASLYASNAYRRIDGDAEVAQVHALLAIAAAVERLARAVENLDRG